MIDGDMIVFDMVIWLKDDVLKVFEIIGILFEFSGNGYVKS